MAEHVRLPVVVVGSNRLALTCACRLLRQDASLEVLVVSASPSGEWLEAFRERARRTEGLPLRETRNVHFHPEPEMLSRWATRKVNGAVPVANMGPPRDSEFVRSSKDTVPLATPTLYADFAQWAIARDFPSLKAAVIKDHVVAVTPIDEPNDAAANGLPCPGAGVRVTLRSGATVVAGLAIHCAVRKTAVLPAWATKAIQNHPAAGGIAHAEDVDVRQHGSLANKEVVVVGGGMVAAALCAAAARRGATVTLVHRRTLARSEQDADVAFAGPKGRAKLRACGTDYPQRLRLCLRARPHATLNRQAWKELQALIKSDSLAVLQDTEVSEAHYDDAVHRWKLDVSTNGEEAGTLEADHVWLATGRTVDVAGDPVLSKLARTHPARLVGRLPVLHDEARGLCWPGAPLCVLGAAAALQVGPYAGLPAGYRICADAACNALARLDEAPRAFVSEIALPAGAEMALLGEDELDDEAVAAMRSAAPPKPALRDAMRINVDDVDPSLPRRQIDRFEWADDDEQQELEIALPLPDEPRLARERVRFQVRERELEVWVLGEKAAWHFHVPRLYRPVIVERCSCRVATAARKVIVTLWKTSTNPWRFVKG